MTRPLVVLRPEPGSTRTAGLIEARGGHAIRLPLFAVVPIAWTPPPPERFDSLMLTSANAIRFAGQAFALYRALPVLAVGEATAVTARAAGLDVALTGDGDAQALMAVAHERGLIAPLHLAGRDRAASGVVAVSVYASDALSIDPTSIRACEDAVILLHSARAAMRFAELVHEANMDRAAIRLAALSTTVLLAAGTGWGASVAVDRPVDAVLVDAALSLAD